MIIAFSGHRPDKLPNKETGYKLPNPTYLHICHQIDKALKEFKPEKCISGMALGVDQYAAEVCIRLNIPFIAAIPFKGQEKMWPKQSQLSYQTLLDKAIEKIIVCEGNYAPYKMQKRNEWMINNCDKLIAVWDQTKGGTANCVEYAKSINKDIYLIDPRI